MSTQAAVGTLAALSFDGIRLGVPQAQVMSIDVIGDVAPVEGGARWALGRIDHGQDTWRVLALSASLSPRPELPSATRLCICLGAPTAGVGIALACEAVEPLVLGAGRVPTPLPECMRTPGSPIHALLADDAGLCLVTDSVALGAYLRRRGYLND